MTLRYLKKNEENVWTTMDENTMKRGAWCEHNEKRSMV
jgi:hypothetical protein